MIVNYGDVLSTEARMAVIREGRAIAANPLDITPADPLARKFDVEVTDTPKPPQGTSDPFPLGLVLVGVGVLGVGAFLILRKRKAAP